MKTLEEVRRLFYTYTEARSLLGVSRMTMWRWMQSGKLPVSKLGQELLFEKGAVAALQDSRRLP
jgi:excisionase family DNA binding protein